VVQGHISRPFGTQKILVDSGFGVISVHHGTP